MISLQEQSLAELEQLKVELIHLVHVRWGLAVARELGSQYVDSREKLRMAVDVTDPRCRTGFSRCHLRRFRCSRL